MSLLCGSCLPAAAVATWASVLGPGTGRGLLQPGTRGADTEAIARHFLETLLPRGLFLWWLLRREEGRFGLAAARWVSLQLKTRCQLRKGGVPWGSFGPCPRVGAPRPERGLDLMSPGHNTVVCTPLVHKCLTYRLEHWTLRR